MKTDNKPTTRTWTFQPDNDVRLLMAGVPYGRRSQEINEALRQHYATAIAKLKLARQEAESQVIASLSGVNSSASAKAVQVAKGLKRRKKQPA